jgi:putative membrane protein
LLQIFYKDQIHKATLNIQYQNLADMEMLMTSLRLALSKRRGFIGGMAAPIAVILFFTLGAVPSLAQQSSPYYGPHMWGGGWWMFMGPLMMLLFIVAIIAVVVLLVRWLAGPRHGGAGMPGARTPIDILRERFARGEIDKEEFEERRRILGE